MAIVTGSTYGIGKAVAKVLSEEGAVSIITGRSEDLGYEVAEDLIANGGEAEYFPLDVTEEEIIADVRRTQGYCIRSLLSVQSTIKTLNFS
ncbi:MAG: SDR family NAD(P)-dependent oxidoreductase [Archaeoglobaceae archaeon]